MFCFSSNSPFPSPSSPSSPCILSLHSSWPNLYEGDSMHTTHAKVSKHPCLGSSWVGIWKASSGKAIHSIPQKFPKVRRKTSLPQFLVPTCLDCGRQVFSLSEKPQLLRAIRTQIPGRKQWLITGRIDLLHGKLEEQERVSHALEVWNELLPETWYVEEIQLETWMFLRTVRN